MARQRKFRALPEVTNDIRAIRRRSEELAVLVIEKLADLRGGRIEGQPLGELAGTGGLSDCRKIYVGLDAVRPTHRIVYRQRDDGVVEIIEVVAVGEREALAVYVEALKRLGRRDTP